MTDQQRKRSKADIPDDQTDQGRKLVEAARELGADQSEQAFNGVFLKLATVRAVQTRPKAKK